jgi:hypothetical protein
MNCLVGRILSLGFTEEQCFWILVQVIEKYLPIDYFSVMNGIVTDLQVLTELLKQHAPLLGRHLTSVGIELSMFTV